MVIRPEHIAAATMAFFAGITCGCQSREEGEPAPPAAEKKQYPLVLLSGQPVTVQVKPSAVDLAKLREQIAGAPDDAARLLVGECIYKENKGGVTSIRVFAEKPGAGPMTSIEDPHYIGSIVPGVEAKQSVLMNLAPFLRRQGRGEWKDHAPESVKITFVLMTEAGAEAHVEIGKVAMDFSRE